MTAFTILFSLAAGCWALALSALLIDVALDQKPLLVFPLAAAGFGLWLAAWINFLVKLYRGWSVVQPLRQLEVRLPSPKTAVAYLFIPCFNYYWMFVATAGLIRRINLLLRDRLMEHHVFNAGLATSYCVAQIVSAIVLGLAAASESAGAWGFLFVVQIGACALTYLFAQQLTRAINMVRE